MKVSRQAPGGKSPSRALLDSNGSPSLGTLAAHLGLSRAAISRVLNRAPAAKSIPPATQERIFAAARELNYRPNVLARSLRRGRSMTIGVLVPEISEGYATLVLAGLEQGLQQAGYAFFLQTHRHREDFIERSKSLLAERAVDGIVAIDTVLEHPGPLPLVTISCPFAGNGSTNIVLNHERAADVALEHLFGMGHREIAFIKGQPFSSDTASRWKAIRRTTARLKLALRPALQVELQGDAPDHEPGFCATQRLLATGVPFTALLAFNDVSAIGAVRALREAGLSVPRDVSVLGFDDIQSAAYQNPPLTTVRQPLHDMGLLAAEAIIARITAGTSPETMQITVEPELVIRGSTAAVRPGVTPTGGERSSRPAKSCPQTAG